MFGSLGAVHSMKVELKYFTSKQFNKEVYITITLICSLCIQIALFLVADGALCATIFGMKMMQTWCAINLALKRQTSYTHQRTSTIFHPLHPFGLILSVVLDMKNHCHDATLLLGEVKNAFMGDKWALFVV